jgi:PIN domain nuclease of toxin-antitoxin system
MNRPLLLDTCAALWIVSNEISAATASVLTDARDNGLPIFVSPITAWEIGISARKGRFKSPYSPQRWFELLVSKPGTYVAELTAQIMMESSFLPGLLGSDDPADRIIAATAREYGYTVMTRDRALLDYGREGHLSVLEC